MIEYEKRNEDVLKTTDSQRHTVATTSLRLPKGVTNEQMIDRAGIFAKESSAAVFRMAVVKKWMDKAIGIKKGVNHAKHILYNDKAGRNLPSYFLFIPSWVTNYVEELFPGMRKHDPFDEPEYYTFPYEHVTLEFMFTVHQMPQRLELLQLAEGRKMRHMDFVNYVINHIICHNKDVGKTVFEIKPMHNHKILYIKNHY